MNRGTLAVVGLACLAPWSVSAESATQKARPEKVETAANDGLSGGGFYLEADSLVSDQTSHTLIAKGSVEARYKGRILRAEEVDYNSTTQIVSAHGAVTIINPDGTTQFADSLTLDKDLSDGFGSGFATRLQGDVKIAATSARRRGPLVTELDHVVYTPCPVCAEDAGGQPTWSIRARKVIQDKKRKTIQFNDAVIQVLGVGVVYLPYLKAADPTSERRSGFLLPVIQPSGRRGFSYAQSYYQVISASQDLTLTPEISSRVNPFLTLDWRKRFYSGSVNVRGGFTYDRDFDSEGQKFGSLTSRSFILGSGQFDLSPHWHWGFTAERASDKLIFDKYGVGDPFKDHGLYAVDDRRLISQIYAERQDQRSYLSVAAISVQGLRATDQQSTIPTIAPLIEARFEPEQAILGGRLRLAGSGVVLTRSQSPIVAGLDGTDSRRATLQADWRRTITFSNGLRLSPFLSGRADIYGVDQLPPPLLKSARLTRGFGTAGVDISYPLIKTSGRATYVLEPLAQLAISANSSLDPRIPNEDSTLFEFDETNLFQVNRSPGYDLYQGGRSITLGGRATAILNDGRSASLMFGRRLAAHDDPVLPLRTGLRTALSDYILAADATPIKGVRLYSRLRLDENSWRVNRFETGVEFTTARANGYLSYLQEVQPITGLKTKSLDVHGEAFPLKHWGVSVYAIVDNGDWRRRDFGLVYRDGCTRVEVLYRHDETTNGTLGPSSSVVVRLSLATFGNSGGNSGYSH